MGLGGLDPQESEAPPPTSRLSARISEFEMLPKRAIYLGLRLMPFPPFGPRILSICPRGATFAKPRKGHGPGRKCLAEKLPWFPYYGYLFFDGEAFKLMDHAGVGRYLRPLWHPWIHGSIPRPSRRPWPASSESSPRHRKLLPAVRPRRSHQLHWGAVVLANSIATSLSV